MKITITANSLGNLNKGITIEKMKFAGPDFSLISYIMAINNTNDQLVRDLTYDEVAGVLIVNFNGLVLSGNDQILEFTLK